MADGDGAAVDVHLAGIPAHVFVDRAGLGGEGFVGFDQIEVLVLPSRPRQRLAAGRDRPGAHHRRIDPGGGEGGDARQRGQPTFGRLGGGHDDQRAGAIVDAAGVAGGDRAVLAECRAQLAHGVHGAVVADIFVLIDHHIALAALDGDGRDFTGEFAGFLRGAGLVLAGDGEFVLFFAGDLVGAGDVFRRGAHVIAVEGVPQPVFDHGVDEGHVAHSGAGAQIGGVRRHAHAFLPAGDHHAAFAGADLLGGESDRAQAGAAHLVDAERRRGVRNAGRAGGLAGWVLPLGGGQHLAEDHFVHIAGVDPGAAHRGLDGGAAEHVRGHRAEGTHKTADRRARGGNDNDIFHL